MSDLDWVGDVPNANSSFGEFMNDVQGVADGATKPIQRVNHDHIAAAGVNLHGDQARPVNGGAGSLIAIDLCGIDAGFKSASTCRSGPAWRRWTPAHIPAPSPENTEG